MHSRLTLANCSIYSLNRVYVARRLNCDGRKKIKFCKYLKKTTRYAHNQKGKVSNSIVRTFTYPAISILCTFQPFKIKFVLFSSPFNILFCTNFFPVFQISNFKFQTSNGSLWKSWKKLLHIIIGILGLTAFMLQLSSNILH